MKPSTRKWHGAALLIALALAGAQCAAQSTAQPLDAPRPAARPAVTQQSVDQKQHMLESLLTQSPIVARVLTSQDEAARRHLSHARELAQHAHALSHSGILRGADALLNEAITEISRAQQRVPDPGTLQAGERARYSQLEDSVSALQRTALIALPAASARQRDTSVRSHERADALIEQAASLARANRYLEANGQLDQALVLLLRDASSRLAGHTIVYDRRFADAREEFDFELERYRSFERLVPLAVLEFRPANEAAALIDRYMAQASQARERGEALRLRDPRGAIKQVVEGSEALRRALQTAGLVVPQSLEPE